MRVSHVQQADVSVEPRDPPAREDRNAFHIHAKSVFSSDGPDWKDEKDGRKVVECD